MLLVEKNNRCSLDILHVSHSGCVGVKRVTQMLLTGNSKGISEKQ